MIAITGGAGFIGSVLAWRLNRMDKNRLLLVDNLGTGSKWRNLTGLDYYLTMHKDEFPVWLWKNGEREGVEVVFHLGACSSTAEHDMNYLLKNNVHYSMEIFRYCRERQIPFVYASSAATYGDGLRGYQDDHALVRGLRPINPYGLSKQMFDLWVLRQQEFPPFWAGLKFFNVYGPNEYHKGGMRSLVCKAVPQIKKSGCLRLFKSEQQGIPHGEQKRDFIYVKDAVEVMIHLWESFCLASRETAESGLYNLGTGRARSFADLGRSVFKAMGQEPRFEWVEMPEQIRKGYQYFTESCQEKLRTAGRYKKPFTPIEEGVYDYVAHYLSGESRYLQACDP